MKNNKNGLSTVTILVIVFMVVASMFLLKQKDQAPKNTTGNQAQTSQNTYTIQNSSDFDTLAVDLDNMNPDQLDKDLTQLDSDNAAF